MVWVEINGEKKQYAAGTTYLEISLEYQPLYPNDIVLVLAGGRLKELFRNAEDGECIAFITTANIIGHQTYQRSVHLLMLKAIYDVEDREKLECVRIYFSLSKGVYCELQGESKVDKLFLKRVKERMRQLVEEDIPIQKTVVGIHEAVEKFHEYKMYDKERLFRFRRNSQVNLYRLGNFEDYFYGYMAPSTGYLKYFDLFLYDRGFVLQLPSLEAVTTVPPFVPQNRLFEVMKQSMDWGHMLEVDSVGDLNCRIAEGKINELILVQEALMEKKLADIAEKIVSQPHKKFVMIAGPSSSGKTTFSRRLSIQLTAQGMHPHPISVDNYFVNREFTPRDENGELNYESIESIDIKQFNEDMNALLRGETVSLPTFDFVSGRRVYKGDYLKLKKDGILVIEGIHCLNDRLTPTLPLEHKFKIYISALTQLNVDEHNRVSSTDGRLLRRIIRDARTRGTSAKETIARWASVQRGEEENIFPYQESADVMFNSSLNYEVSILKQYAEPLLFNITEDEPEYLEAKRLLKFLDYFLGVSSENIPINSILREFIGGSCFHV